MGGDAGGHEQALAERGVRKGLGAYYTPPDVVDGLLRMVLDPLLDERAEQGVGAVASLRVLDPACGTGNFLVAAVERITATLVELGLDRVEAAGRAVRCVRGIEIDAATARICRANLKAIHPAGGGRSIVRGDALLDENLVPAGTFDVVVGNPPFLSQLAASTSRSRDDAGRLRTRFGPAVGPYTDPAAVFLLFGLAAARPTGGVVALIEPVAVLSGRDTRGVRGDALAIASLAVLWIAEQPVFDADVEVCAPVLVRGGTAQTTLLVRGRDFRPGPTTNPPSPSAGSWSSLLAALQDLPDRSLLTDGVVGDIADATADFRDQYYGLAGAVIDQPDGSPVLPRLVTSGLIDPGRLRWGERTCRFNKTAYRYPRVELRGLTVPMQEWAARRLVPKVLVATQTRVLEAVVDPEGDVLPSVPVVTVTSRGGREADLWRVAALLCSPPVTLVAAQRHLGSARNATALRLSASDVLALPLPQDRAAWERATRSFAAASGAVDEAAHRELLRASARAMDEAYGLIDDDELLSWWTARLPQAKPVTSDP